MHDLIPHEKRPRIEESYEEFLSTHIGRAATVLLCTITELQAECRFQDANINARICDLWAVLKPLFEANELYDARYSQLMLDKGIAS